MPVMNVKTREQMLLATLDSLQKNAGINSISPGSIARAFAEAIHSEIYDLYNALRLSIEQSSLATANGANLDMIGALYNVPRRSISSELVSERATANIEFFIDKPYSAAITIAAGTLVFNDINNYSSVQYMYELTGDVIIAAGNTRAYGSVKAKFADNNITAARNTLVKHNFIAPPGVVVFCNNPKEVYSTLNSESDDNYRRRIIAAVRGSNTGTAESIRFAALAVKGVKDAKIREASFGIGSCDIILVPETRSSISTMSQYVIEQVKAIKPVGVNINVRIAERKPVDINMSLVLREGTNTSVARAVENQARIFINRYINTLSIGDSLSITEVERQARLASEVIVSATINSVRVEGQNIPNKDYRLSDDKSYMTAGSLSIYSVIMGSSDY
jgi:uncharacterized phage protein gp47/JayE